MSYLLDKKTKRKKLGYYTFFVIILLVLFYFRVGVGQKLSSITQTVFHPVLVAGNNIGGKFTGVSSFFSSKNSLIKENTDLKSQHTQDVTTMLNYNSLLAENASLKEILGRKNEKVPMVLAAVLSKPNQSPYDTLVIDAGIKEGITAGSMVFALGNIPIGRVDVVYENTAKVILFSSSGEKTNVVVGKPARPDGRSGGDIFMEAVGRGGGNFEMTMPRDSTLIAGDQVLLPGITPHVLGIVQTIISDPRDAFQKALLVSPVNIQELKFVQVES